MRQLRRQDQPVDADQQDFDSRNGLKLCPDRRGVNKGPVADVSLAGRSRWIFVLTEL